MKKEKTITVTVCDSCINQDAETWQCAHCEKDACADCGSGYEVVRRRPEGKVPGTCTYTFTLQSAGILWAFICNDCSKNELSTHLLRFGFESPELAHSDTYNGNRVTKNQP